MLTAPPPKPLRFLRLLCLLMALYGCSHPSPNSSPPPPPQEKITWRRIPPGSFIMGSPPREKYRDLNEKQRKVSISRAFEIMSKEVTQEQWVQVMGNNPAHFKEKKHCPQKHQVKKGIPRCPHYPIEKVSWNDVQKFIQKFNQIEGKAGCQGRPDDPPGCYRLPTEAEWEYAARGGTTTAYSFGEEAVHLPQYAWYAANAHKHPHPVGSKRSNFYGLYDIHGNVWEWTQDQYQKSPPGKRNPLSVTGEPKRVMRGGSWASRLHSLRSANRLSDRPDRTFFNVGFRLVKQVEDITKVKN